MINRERMVYAYMGFLAAWYAGVILAVKFLGLSVMEGVGLGTAGGVFIGAFKDMWQFIWRKASPQEENSAATRNKEESETPVPPTSGVGS